jgi:hypothetical protein
MMGAIIGGGIVFHYSYIFYMNLRVDLRRKKQLYVEKRKSRYLGTDSSIDVNKESVIAKDQEEEFLSKGYKLEFENNGDVLRYKK